jgi:hypothetical protein
VIRLPISLSSRHRELASLAFATIWPLTLLEKLTDHHLLLGLCLPSTDPAQEILSPESTPLWPPTLLEKWSNPRLDCVFRPPTLRENFLTRPNRAHTLI